MRAFIWCTGLWMPGVSRKTTCASGRVLTAEDPVAGRLRLVRDDGHLRPDQAVEQRGLAGVGPADEGNEAGLLHGTTAGLAHTQLPRQADARVCRLRADTHPVDATMLGLQHLDGQPVDVERLPTAGTRPRWVSR